MASRLEAIEKIPVWQRLVGLVVGAVAIVALWYLMYYQDEVDAHQAAEVALTKAEGELVKAKKDKEDFLAKEQEHEELESDLNKKMEVLPMSAATVDNLMQTFQQQARLVGLTVESWTPEPEDRADFYARLPVKVKATGSWPQAGEFFRRVSELDRIVSVDNLTLKRKDKGGAQDPTKHPVLDIEFEASTYRFLTEAERQAAAATAGGAAAGPSRRSGGAP